MYTKEVPGSQKEHYCWYAPEEHPRNFPLCGLLSPLTGVKEAVEMASVEPKDCDCAQSLCMMNKKGEEAGAHRCLK